MGLLDGDLAPVFAGALGWLLLDGTLHRRTLTPNGVGGFTEAEVAIPVKGMVEAATQAMREAEGYSDTDVSILLLAYNVGPIKLDDELTIRGERYHLMQPITAHVGEAHWTARGRKKS